MKKLVFLSVALATVMLLSCGGGNRHQAEREEDTVDVNDLIRDHTLYGLCGGVPSASQLKVVTDNGDTLTLPYPLLPSIRCSARSQAVSYPR